MSSRRGFPLGAALRHCCVYDSVWRMPLYTATVQVLVQRRRRERQTTPARSESSVCVSSRRGGTAVKRGGSTLSTYITYVGRQTHRHRRHVATCSAATAEVTSVIIAETPPHRKVAASLPQKTNSIIAIATTTTATTRGRDMLIRGAGNAHTRSGIC